MNGLAPLTMLLTVIGAAAATAQVTDTLPDAPPIDTQAIDAAIQDTNSIYGTITTPNADGPGLHLFLELTRSICLAAEAGAALDQLAPDGYSVTDKELHQLGWLMGDETASALSVTGDEILDTEGGHPYFYVFDNDGDLTCRATWKNADPISAADATFMAQMFQVEPPARFQMIPTDWGAIHNLAMQIGLLAFQRPCGTQWCAANGLFRIDPTDGIEISLTLTLNP